MPRGLDHIVHAVRDLDAAAELYRRLGFTVGARNRHSWGTHNHVIQLPGFFVELLTVAEPEKLGTDGFSALFGTFNRRFLADQEGLSMLILESGDAAADAAAFRAAGIGVSDALSFEREGRRPDGTGRQGRLLARLRARPQGAPRRFCRLPAAFSGEFLESRLPAARQQRQRRRRCRAGRRQSERPPYLPVGVQRRARAFRHVERRHRIDAARRHQGHGPGGFSRAISAPSHRTSRAVRGSLRCGFGCATAPRWRPPLNAGGVAFSSRMGSIVVAPETAMGATLVFE